MFGGDSTYQCMRLGSSLSQGLIQATEGSPALTRLTTWLCMDGWSLNHQGRGWQPFVGGEGGCGKGVCFLTHKARKPLSTPSFTETDQVLLDYGRS